MFLLFTPTGKEPRKKKAKKRKDSNDMTKGSKQVDETGRAGRGYKSNVCEPKETQQEDNY